MPDVGKDKGKKSRRLRMFVVVVCEQFKGWCIVMPGTASCKTLVDWLSVTFVSRDDADSECPQGVQSDNREGCVRAASEEEQRGGEGV